MKNVKVLYISPECKPFSKMGGLGDVAGELPLALKKKGIDIEIVTPAYSSMNIKEACKFRSKYLLKYYNPEKKSLQNEEVEIYETNIKDVPVNLIKNSTYFEGVRYGIPFVESKPVAFYDDIIRFSFFSEACLILIKEKVPDIVHINDWCLGYLFARMFMEKISAKKVLTIHNIGYQGNIGKETIKNWDIENIFKDNVLSKYFEDPHPEYNSVNALRLALELSDRINAVSPNYCNEITKPEDNTRFFEGGNGLDIITNKLYNEGKLIGILNGFEYSEDPTDVKFQEKIKMKDLMKNILSKDFKNPKGFLLGFVGRAVEQKFKLLMELVTINGVEQSVLEHILDIPNINLAVVATGLKHYENFLDKKIKSNDKYKDKCSVTLAFDKEKAMQISLGSDLFLMPSLYEPCGITQMESLSNATPPLVRWTGGLVDTVKSYKNSDGTGFGFDGQTQEEVLLNLIQTVNEACSLFFEEPEKFSEIQKRGFKARFLWEDSAENYIKKLYNN